MLFSTWRHFGARLGVLSLVLGLVTGPAGAGNSKTWNRQLQQTVAELRAGDWKEAKQGAQRGLDDLARSLAPSKGAGSAVGMFLMCRALAEAGLGEEREAVWDWQIAQQLDARLERWNLHEFGQAGAFLDRHRLESDPPPSVTEADTPAAAGVSLPSRISTPAPEYPEGARQLQLRALVGLRVVIGVDGYASHPRLVDEGPFETFILSASDAIRSWRFEPARRDGLAIPLSWKLSITFKLGSL